jgi:hypothetical protein
MHQHSSKFTVVTNGAADRNRLMTAISKTTKQAYSMRPLEQSIQQNYYIKERRDEVAANAMQQEQNPPISQGNCKITAILGCWLS